MTSANIVSIQQISEKDHDELIKHYKHYQNMLLQVTAKNRSVLLRRIYNKHNFDLAQLEMIKEGTIQRVTSKTLKNIRSVLTSSAYRVSPAKILLDSIDEEEAYTARSKLKALSRNLSYIEEETGQQAGYIGFPFLQGHVTPSFFVRGPLVLFPISLERRRQKGGWYIQFANRRPILNGALIASLRKKGNYNLPEDYEESFDEMIEDVANAPDDSEEYFFDRVCRWIKKMVPVDTAKNQLETVQLPELDRDRLDQMVRQPLHLANYKIIGNFPQADDQIYKDYNYLIKDTSRRWPGVVGSLLGAEPDVKATKRDNESDGDGSVDLDNISDNQINTVLKSDSSQDEIIVRSKKQDLLVVGGPPGTGKSQVIVNLIADALTNGKKILVVCQKRAALEVVRQRLEEVALDKYVVFLAKEIDDRTLMYRQLYDIIMEEQDGRPLKQAIKNISQDIDSSVRYLSGLGAALRKEHFDGATAHKIYSKADGSYKPVLDLSQRNLEVTWPNLAEFVEKIDNIEKPFKKLENENHPWFGRKDFSGFGLMEENRLNNLLEELLSLHPECMLAESAVKQESLKTHFDEYPRHSSTLKQKTTDLSGFGPENARTLENLLEELLSLHPECMLAESAVKQESLKTHFDEYPRHSSILKQKTADLSGFGPENARTLENLLEEMLSLHPECMLAESAVEQGRLKTHFDKYLRHSSILKQKTADLSGFGPENARTLENLLEELLSLHPECMLTESTVEQVQLESYLNGYLSNKGFLKRKKRKEYDFQIRQILGVTDGGKNFVEENLDKIKKGIKFWETISEMLCRFDGDGHTGLRKKINGPNMVPALHQLKKTVRAYRLQQAAAGGISKILGVTDVDESFVAQNAGGVRSGIKYWEAMSKLLSCFDGDGHARLRQKINGSDTAPALRQLKNTVRAYRLHQAAAGGISKILGVTDVDESFVAQNAGGVRSGIKYWEAMSKLLSCFDGDGHARLRQKINGSDTAPALRQLKNTVRAYRLHQAAAGGISKILGVTDVDESFVAQNAGGVRNGIKYWEAMSKLLEYFDSSGQRRLGQKMKKPRKFISVLREMRESLDIDELQDFDQKKAEYKNDIWWILKQAKKRMMSRDNWTKMIKEEIYFHWLAQIEQKNPILKGSHVNEYQRKSKDLVQLMEKKRHAVKESIQFEIGGAIHPDNMYHRRSEDARAWREFAGELRKKRKVWPVRKMFGNYASRMFKVAPCWLASPESVSKIFPMQRNLFDLVIVDEASQLAVERAIPFLYRASHVIVAGDEKQLPPFDLFQIIEDDEDDDMPEERSLLELSKNKFRTLSLLWHYRSKYQDLINFSNQAFYNGMLNVAPNVEKDPKNPPIRWIECNGRWENNTNREEARTVVRELKNIWTESWKSTGKLPSVGIITFNEPQQDLIKDEVDKMLDADPEFMELHATTRKNRKDSWLFVKNIENVQGDERDIIMFSIGYARDADGLFAQNFGSLSKKGGENRLNVAVTRARQEMIVACSVSPTDIKPTSRNDGPRRLRQFLRYAKATASQDTGAQKAILKEINPNMDRTKKARVQEFDLDFEMQVFKGLERRGYTIDSQVGQSGYVIDLAIHHPHDPSRYILGIECDGATFHSAKSVKERDVMSQEFLESKGWNIARIWSRNWWKSPDRELDRIEVVIKDLRKETQP